MKIAVSAMEKNLIAHIDPRFGRCQYFIIIDPKSMDFETIQNESASAMGGAGGAGIQAAQNMVNEEVNVVISGNIGPNAFQILSKAGIRIFIGTDGTVKNVVKQFKKRELKETMEPNVISHFGGNLMTKRSNENLDFDKMIEGIQKELDENVEKTYSKKVIEECENPQNIGRMPDPDAVGIITGSCGDTMEIFLKIKGKRIIDIQYMTDGCGATIACGSTLTKMVKDKNFHDVSRITDQDLINALDGLPDENSHCAKLAVDTLHIALDNYLIEEEKEYF